MVLLHVKSAEEVPEFLFECAATAAVADVAASLAALTGLQARLLALCRRLRERCADAEAGSAGDLERALDEAEAYASKEQVRHNRFLSPYALKEHIKNIKKKCPTALQESPESSCLPHPSSDPDNKKEKLQLWWAGKELGMGQKLCDYIGANDKTKIVIRLIRVPDEP